MIWGWKYIYAFYYAFPMAASSDSIAQLEPLRRRLRLTQIAFASQLGVTQGHYSKVVRGIIPPGQRLSASIAQLLSESDQAGSETSDELAARISALAASIQRQCIELMHLAEAARARDIR